MSPSPVNASFSVRWKSHDAWSETYLGIWRLIYEVLPDNSEERKPEDAALCQLALIGSSHLMEVSLGKLVQSFVGIDKNITQKNFDSSSYYELFENFVPALTGKSLDREIEPFISTERLRRRRNATIHKSSELATISMARSAFFSAIEGTKALYMHFNLKFPYEHLIGKYPYKYQEPFSTVAFPGNT